MKYSFYYILVYKLINGAPKISLYRHDEQKNHLTLISL